MVFLQKNQSSKFYNIFTVGLKHDKPAFLCKCFTSSCFYALYVV